MEIKLQRIGPQISTLLITLSRIFKDNNEVDYIWFSHIPDAESINHLNNILGPRKVKPVLQPFPQINATSFMGFRELGCLVKLSGNYHVMA